MIDEKAMERICKLVAKGELSPNDARACVAGYEILAEAKRQIDSLGEPERQRERAEESQCSFCGVCHNEYAADLVAIGSAWKGHHGWKPHQWRCIDADKCRLRVIEPAWPK